MQIANSALRFLETPEEVPLVEIQVWDTLEWAQAILEWARKKGIGEVTLARQEGGKPFMVEAPGCHFNVSTTKGRTVAAFSSIPVGIDWEWGKREASYMRIARRYFFPEEIRWLETADHGELGGRFHQLWTSKEAGVKLDGRGLYTGGLCALRVVVPVEGSTGWGWLEEEKVWFQRVVWPGDFMITVAAWCDFRLALPEECPKVGGE